jgi:hypothetical protein
MKTNNSSISSPSSLQPSISPTNITIVLTNSNNNPSNKNDNNVVTIIAIVSIFGFIILAFLIRYTIFYLQNNSNKIIPTNNNNITGYYDMTI